MELYAVYGSSTKSGSYAGYFEGDVQVSQNLKVLNKVTATDSGDADMKAYAYGYILTDGTINTTSSSNGFTAYKVATS